MNTVYSQDSYASYEKAIYDGFVDLGLWTKKILITCNSWNNNFIKCHRQCDTSSAKIEHIFVSALIIRLLRKSRPKAFSFFFF